MESRLRAADVCQEHLFGRLPIFVLLFYEPQIPRPSKAVILHKGKQIGQRHRIYVELRTNQFDVINVGQLL